MKEWVKAVKHFSLLSQLGISLVAPLLLCLFLCSWLNSRFSIGGWIYLPGFFFGLGGSCMTAYKVYRSVMSGEKKRKRPDGAAFNDHI